MAVLTLVLLVALGINAALANFAENEPPSFVQEPDTTFVFELDENGEPATLTLVCDTAGEPPPTVVWFLNGMEVNSSLVLEDGTLSIPNITEGEFASREGVSYYCTATNTFGTIRSRSVDVFYAFFDGIIAPNGFESIDVILNDDVALLCDVQASPPPMIEWLDDFRVIADDPIGNTVRYLNGGRYLLLSSLSLQQASRTYHCRVTNALIHTTVESGGNYTLNDLGDAPVSELLVFKELEDNVALVGETVVFSFVAISSPPIPREYLLDMSAGAIDTVGSLGIVENIQLPLDGNTYQILLVLSDLQFPIHSATLSVYDSSSNADISTAGLQSYSGQTSIRAQCSIAVFFRADMNEEDCSPAVEMLVFDDEFVKPIRSEPASIFTRTPNTLDHPAGRAISLSCVASGSPAPVVTWYFNGELLESSPLANSGLTISGGTVDIPVPTNEHSGMYQCFVSNAASLVQAAIALQVPATPCSTEEFYCVVEDFCVPLEYICDGIPDCFVGPEGDGSDESDCPPRLPDSDNCTETDVRLVGGQSGTGGYIEVCVSGFYTGICGEGFDVRDASVLCSQLGLPSAGLPVNGANEFRILRENPIFANLGCLGNENSIFDCPPAPAPPRGEGDDGMPLSLFCSPFSAAGVICQNPVPCSDGDLRLVNGIGPRDGQVEVCYGGIWGSVCSFRWSYDEAAVTCRQLGFNSSGALAIRPSVFLDFSPALVETVHCFVDENRLFDCFIDDIGGIIECGSPHFYAGVRCDDYQPTGCEDGEVRLARRETPGRGQVEVCLNNTWGTVCRQGWGDSEAAVVCRQLGFISEGSRAEFFDGFPSPSGPIHLTDLDCNGTETNLLECPVSPGFGLCNSLTDASVQCAELPRILIEPPSLGPFTVEVGKSIRVECMPDETVFPRANITAYRLGPQGERMFIATSFFGVTVFDSDDTLGATPELSGQYLCVSQNAVGMRETIITVFVEVPAESDTSSTALLRFSLPQFDRLDPLLDSTVAPEEFLFIIAATILLRIDPERFGVQIVNCSYVPSQEIDIERRLERIECVITNFPAVVNTIDIADEAALILELTFEFSFLVFFNTSEFGFCNADLVETEEFGSYFWPESEVGSVVSLPCAFGPIVPGGAALRFCDLSGEWVGLELSGCNSTTSIQPCPNREFFCPFEGRCIPNSYRCDQFVDCLTGVDEIDCPGNFTGCTTGELRLTNGLTANEGRVEICIDGTFGVITSERFGVQEAGIVCRDLGLPGLQVGIPMGIFSILSVPMHLGILDCTGDEGSLLECPIGVSAPEEFEGDNDANFFDTVTRAAGVRCQAAVNCSNGDIQLVGGRDLREGRVELCSRGLWGTVAPGDDWGYREAAVVCRELEYDTLGALPLQRAFFGPGAGPVLITDILFCNGSEGRLIDCPGAVITGMDIRLDDLDRLHEFDVGVRCEDYQPTGCVDGDVRLTHRDSNFRGQVQVCVNDTWGTVCSNSWDDPDAEVVCRQLGLSQFGDALGFPIVSPGSGPIHLSDLACQGVEETLLDCPLEPGEGQMQACSHQQDASVECGDLPEIRVTPFNPNSTYFIEENREIELICSVESGYNPSHVLAHRVGEPQPQLVSCDILQQQPNGGPTIPRTATVLAFRDDGNGIPANATGQYICLAENCVGRTQRNLSVTVLVPSGEGSSAYLRLSTPEFDRLVLIFTDRSDKESTATRSRPPPTRESSLRQLSQLFLRGIEEDQPGIQRVDCSPVSRRPIDTERRYDRAECIVTTHPAINDTLTLVNRAIVSSSQRLPSLVFFPIGSATGFCDVELLGFIRWPETEAGSEAQVECPFGPAVPGGIARRVCGVDRVWQEPQADECIAPQNEDLFVLFPDEEGGVYRVPVGTRFELLCRTLDNSTVFWSRVDDAESRLISLADPAQLRTGASGGGILPEDGGTYECVADTAFGALSLAVEIIVLVPEGEGSSAVLRLSFVNLTTLAEIFQRETVSPEFALFQLAQLIRDSAASLSVTRTVFPNCTFVTNRPIDVANFSLRADCNITETPASETTLEFATMIADTLPTELNGTLIIPSLILVSEFGFCDHEVLITNRGNYTWPETAGDNEVELECQLGPAAAIGRRRCDTSGEWEDPQLENCTTLVALQLQQLEEELNNELTEENVGEVNQDLRDIIGEAEEEDQTAENLEVVTNVFISTADVLSGPTAVVEEATVNDIVEVLDTIQVWPEEVVEVMGPDIVEAFEEIVTVLVEQENFTSLTSVGEDLIFTAERVGVESLMAEGRRFSSSRDPNGALSTTSGDVGSAEEPLAPEEIGTVFLPPSLFTRMESGAEVGIFFSLYESPSLFPIAGESDLPSEDGIMSQVGSSVVAATLSAGQTEFSNLTDPVIVVVRLNTALQNITRITCVSYDFNLADGIGNWTSEGCETNVSEDDPNIVICSCNHLTNFACLVDVCTRTEGCEISSVAAVVLEVLSFIGVILSAVGLVLTVITLLGFKKLRKRDATKFHIQLCIAIFCMLLVFVIGIDRVPPEDLYGGCVAVSALIHYFTLVAVMWMAAEALLMFQKLVIVFIQITTKYIVIVSIVCWVAPIIPVAVPLGIDWDFMVTRNSANNISFCFIGDRRVFFGAFLGPILAVLLFNLVIFVMVVTVLLRHTRNTMGRTQEQMNRKTTLRLLISITGIVFLFGLTWIFGALTISDASLPFQIIFVVFNGFQGFFIFLFFCVFSKDARELWVEFLTCGHYKSISHTSRVGGAGKFLSGGTKERNAAGTGTYQLTSQSDRKSSAPLIPSLVSEHDVSENPEGQMPMLGGGSSTFRRSNKIKEGGDITCIENPHANDSSEIQAGEVPSLTLEGGSSSEVIEVVFGAERDRDSESIGGPEADAETSNYPTISIVVSHNAAEFEENEIEVSQMEFNLQFDEEGGVQV